MEQYPGFHFANVDQKARIAANQEHVNRRVLSEYIKVIGVPNKDKLGLRELVQKFLKEIVKIKMKRLRIKAKMSDQFWTYFTSDGRKKLLEYNRKEHANVKRYRATELAVLLGWDYKDWQGTAIRELLTNTERKNMMDAVNVPSGGSDESIDKDSSRKRSGTEDENTNPVKMHKPE
ncbi:hypothetical protein ANCDUO_09988 [Ancylostoma duodenale]|uniref:Uncharacterized protein n=1 Tax=Ancylostoma duodenale TaxID=51022 RepID=A0A0C2GLD4_9BILA|nr:hypothetical protein ANCDUO_09988 [Ancylostoma duodenale]